MKIEIPSVDLKPILGHLGRPAFALALIGVFLGLAVAAPVLADLWDQAVHLLGMMMVVLAAVMAILLACWFLFDHFLSFREFGLLIRRWEKSPEGKDSLTYIDARIAMAMALRSGLVFLGICILAHGALVYLDL